MGPDAGREGEVRRHIGGGVSDHGEVKLAIALDGKRRRAGVRAVATEDRAVTTDRVRLDPCGNRERRIRAKRRHVDGVIDAIKAEALVHRTGAAGWRIEENPVLEIAGGVSDIIAGGVFHRIGNDFIARRCQRAGDRVRAGPGSIVAAQLQYVGACRTQSHGGAEFGCVRENDRAGAADLAPSVGGRAGGMDQAAGQRQCRECDAAGFVLAGIHHRGGVGDVHAVIDLEVPDGHFRSRPAGRGVASQRQADISPAHGMGHGVDHRTALRAVSGLVGEGRP